MDSLLQQYALQYGGLGVIALFAWALLRSAIKQQEHLADLLENHLRSLLERQETTNQFLASILESFKRHEEQAVARQNKLLDALKDKG